MGWNQDNLVLHKKIIRMNRNLIASLITVCLTVIFSMSVYCQGIGLGAKIGMDVSKLSNWNSYIANADPSANFENPSTLGLQAGLFADIVFNDYLGAAVELNYEKKGFILKSSSGKRTLALNYLTLPILVKGGYDFDFMKISAVVGPYVGIALSGKVKSYKNEELDKEYSVEFGEGELTDLTNSMGGPKGYKANRFDFGIIAGLQPSVKLGPGEIILDIRYAWGFIDIDNPTADEKEQYEVEEQEEYYSQCNRALNISVGYIFRLGDN